MIINSVKRLFTKISQEDKSNFYTAQALHKVLPRCEYIFTNCSEGFIALLERSNISCWVNEKQSTAGFKIENPTRSRTIEYSTQNLTAELVRLKKGE